MHRKIKHFKKNHPVTFAIILGAGVIGVWRGMWGLMDVYIYPNNYELSSWISTLIGLIILWLANQLLDSLY